MLDTNILISAALFPGKSMEQFIKIASTEHEIVLSSFIIDEFKSVVLEKFPSKIVAVEKFFSDMSYEYVHTPENIPDGLFEIRDTKDYPVLYSAIFAQVDVLVTGDKDFADVIINGLDVCTPQDFLDKYSIP